MIRVTPHPLSKDSLTGEHSKPALVRSKASVWFSMCHQGDQTTVRQIRGARERRLFQSHPKSLAQRHELIMSSYQIGNIQLSDLLTFK